MRASTVEWEAARYLGVEVVGVDGDVRQNGGGQYVTGKVRSRLAHVLELAARTRTRRYVTTYSKAAVRDQRVYLNTL